MTKLTRFASLLCLLYSCSLGHSDWKASIQSAKKGESILSNQYETVAYIHASFLSHFEPSKANTTQDHPSQTLPLALRLPFVELVGGLRSLGPSTESIVEGNYQNFLVGAKDFTPPSGLGMFDYRACYIGISERGSQPDIATVFEKAQMTSIAGAHVWTWSVPPAEGHPEPFKFYATQVADRYFLMTNGEQAFSDAFTELTSSKRLSTNAILEALQTHEYWVYRQIRPGGAGEGKSNVPSNAFAITFFADINAKQTYFEVHKSNHAPKTVSTDLPMANLIHYQQIRPGIWQASIPLTEDPASTNAFYQAMYYLGFGVAL